MKLTKKDIIGIYDSQIRIEFVCECGTEVIMPFDLNDVVNGRGFAVCPRCDENIYLDIETIYKFKRLVGHAEYTSFLKQLFNYKHFSEYMRPLTEEEWKAYEEFLKEEELKSTGKKVYDLKVEEEWE